MDFIFLMKIGRKQKSKGFFGFNVFGKGLLPSSRRRRCEKIQAAYYAHMFPAVDNQHVADLLSGVNILSCRSPGTGKTRMALELLRDTYEGNGQVIQFHPNTTYENFVGGLAPVHTEEGLGLQFKPKPGFLMEAAAAADAGGQVGALPTSGRPDYGLVIKPRFGWQGIGLMLGSMGWKVITIPLRFLCCPVLTVKFPRGFYQRRFCYDYKNCLNKSLIEKAGLD